MVFAALAGLVSVAGSLYATSEQKKATGKANAANLAAQQAAFAWLKENIAKAEGAHKKGILAAEEGFAEATKSVGILGQAARRRALRREKQSLGRADAQAASRGLYSSTAALNARRGVRADTDLNLASIDESVAALHSQVFRDRGRTLMQGQLARMSLYGQFAGQGAQILQGTPHMAANVGAGIGAASGSLAQLLMMYGQQQGQPGASGVFGGGGVF